MEITSGARPLSQEEIEHFHNDPISWGMTAGEDGGPLWNISDVLARLDATIGNLLTEIEELKANRDD